MQILYFVFCVLHLINISLDHDQMMLEGVEGRMISDLMNSKTP